MSRALPPTDRSALRDARRLPPGFVRGPGCLRSPAREPCVTDATFTEPGGWTAVGNPVWICGNLSRGHVRGWRQKQTARASGLVFPTL